jgi:zinc transport system ATP-binding protein
MTSPHPSPPLVNGRGIVVHRAQKRLLDQVDLDVGPGEIVTVIGPNGAGKSTLVRVLLGLVAADAGEIHRRPNLRIGYTPQRFALDPVLPLTARRFLSLSGVSDPLRLSATLDMVGLDDVLDRQLTVLSGGELQRLLLARALLRQPQLLVLDEPVAGVDVSGQAELYTLIARIRDSTGAGILLVSHDLHLVMARTDRVLCIDGHVCCSGHPVEVARDPAFARLFGHRLGEVLALFRHDLAHHQHVHSTHHHGHEAGRTAAPADPP